MFPDNVQVEHLDKISKNTLVEHLGIKFTAVEKDALIGTMPVDYRTKQPMGYLHGGASVSLAETLGSVASVLLIDPKKQNVVGTEISASHIKSATSGLVTGTCKAIHIGRSSHVWEIRVENDERQLVSLVRLTTRVLDRKN